MWQYNYKTVRGKLLSILRKILWQLGYWCEVDMGNWFRTQENRVDKMIEDIEDTRSEAAGSTMPTPTNWWFGDD